VLTVAREEGGVETGGLCPSGLEAWEGRVRGEAAVVGGMLSGGQWQLWVSIAGRRGIAPTSAGGSGKAWTTRVAGATTYRRRWGSRGANGEAAECAGPL
jgi:hypothetical protein